MTNLTKHLKTELNSMYDNSPTVVNDRFSSYVTNKSELSSVNLYLCPDEMLPMLLRCSDGSTELTTAQPHLCIIVDYTGYETDDCTPIISTMRLAEREPIKIMCEKDDGSIAQIIKFEQTEAMALAETLLANIKINNDEAKMYDIIKSACDDFAKHSKIIPF